VAVGHRRRRPYRTVTIKYVEQARLPSLLLLNTKIGVYRGGPLLLSPRSREVTYTLTPTLLRLKMPV